MACRVRSRSLVSNPSPSHINDVLDVVAPPPPSGREFHRLAVDHMRRRSGVGRRSIGQAMGAGRASWLQVVHAVRAASKRIDDDSDRIH